MKTPQAAAPPLLDPACYPHPVGRVELIETHISWVFLAGEYAYKVKKPVRLPFLDFSTLEARRSCCEEELRLNRRTAPGLYLGVVPIAGSRAHPRIGAKGKAIEYALQMRRFEQDALAERIARRGELGDARIDALAAVIASFHASLPGAANATRHGTHDQVVAPALENFDEIIGFITIPVQRERIKRLRAWTKNEGARLLAAFAERKRDGFIRECHGDLHLGNIAYVDGRPVPFDCIEFSAELRWIDVISEVAFLVMDLLEHRLEAGAWRFLNAYLEASGDYRGLRVLNYYLVYRALVRAKIVLIRAHQHGSGGDSRNALESVYSRYLGLAEHIGRPRQPALVVMHGLAGSGKTTVAQALLELIGGVRVRSDVERKRLHGLAARARTHAGPYSGIYAPETNRLTYERLKSVVRDIVASGYTAIVDAAFLWRAPREEFRELARELRVPLVIVS
ncbi:MAG: hypothetical protein A3H35_17380, partial [Betaproteobacteria bacterium RIFCSPLOWO2_02_FULL_62_17]